jgi:hypothetical protein
MPTRRAKRERRQEELHPDMEPDIAADWKRKAETKKGR